MVVARPADVGMEDRGRVRGALGRGPPIELVIEDGFDGAIGPGADLHGPLGSGLDARGAERAGETHDAETGRGSPARDVACLPGFARKAPSIWARPTKSVINSVRASPAAA